MNTTADNPSAQKNWYATIVRPRSEKLVSRLLSQKGIESYVPLTQRIRRYTGKTRKTQITLLPGYVFVYVQNNEVIKVLESDHVYKIITFEGKPAKIYQNEIDFLKVVTGEEFQAERAEEHLVTGDKVILMSGQLTGMRGKLVEHEGRERVLVELETLGIALLMSVPLNVLKKI